MNPFLGVVLHWLGGLASGSFYVPYRAVRNWSWETYWLVGGVFSWVVCPWFLGGIMTHDLWHVLSQQSWSTLSWTYFFGALWGLGGLTFGLSMRYLGMSLGMGIALGYCAAFGTLLPPILKLFVSSVPVPETILQIADSRAGQVTLGGVVVCLLGIGVAALAGLAKERELPEALKKQAIAEFDFFRGILVATFSGIMSACFSFGLTAGTPINEASRVAGTPLLWTGLPKLCVVLAGGFTTNLIWCCWLNHRHKTGYQYLARYVRPEHASRERSFATEQSSPSDGRIQTPEANLEIPRLANYFFSALAGTCWYFQFFFYTMGETQMGQYGFASWTLHMASIIIFSTMWGWIFHEWKGVSRRAHLLIATGISLLVLSTIIIGAGTYLRGSSHGHNHHFRTDMS